MKLEGASVNEGGRIQLTNANVDLSTLRKKLTDAGMLFSDVGFYSLVF